jgi:hypothetical protein
MYIGATNISTYGLKLLKVEDHLFLPARKKILDPPDHGAGSIRFEEFDIRMELFGKFSSEINAAIAVGNLKGKLQSAVTHTFTDASRGLQFTGIVRNGAEVVPYGKAVIIKLKVTVTECTAGSLII